MARIFRMIRNRYPILEQKDAKNFICRARQIPWLHEDVSHVPHVRLHRLGVRPVTWDNS